MYALAILTGMWFINRWIELTKTKNIRRYGWDNPARIKDKEEYTKLVSKVYFIQGIVLICWGEFLILDTLFFNLPLEILAIICGMVFISAFIEVIIINKKRQEFTY